MPGAEEARSRRGWLAFAVLLFALTTVQLFHPLWGSDPRTSVLRPVGERERAGEEPGRRFAIGEADHRFVVWLVARNARTLLTEPHRLFDAEQCFPAENSLALGEPGITLGLLGIPAYVLTDDPVATFNWVLHAVFFLSALAMYLLIRDWTGSEFAAIVAGLLHGFHEIRTDGIITLFIIDNAWTLLALLFARRLFAAGRWRDAVGLAAATCMQLGGSLYPLIAAFVLAVPFTIWLIVRYGLSRLQPAQLAFLVIIVGLWAWGIFQPYLMRSGSGDFTPRLFQFFLPWGFLLPGEPGYPGTFLGILALAGLVLGRRRTLVAKLGDPRWALGIAAILTLLVATGGNEGDRMAALAHGELPTLNLPNLYAMLSAVLPGLDRIRGPGSVYSGTLLALAILAGLGAAGLLRLVPERARSYVGAALILLAWLGVTRPAFLGLEPSVEYRLRALAPDASAIAFFGELDRLGSSGPLLELPAAPGNLVQASKSVLLSAYHQRPTSACYNSFPPPELRGVSKAAARLPDPEAVAILRDTGFTTLVLHGRSKRERARFRSLELLYDDGSRAAYALQLGGADPGGEERGP